MSEGGITVIREETILEEAQRLVYGDRQATYGHPLEDYLTTGRLWAACIDKWMRKLPEFEGAPTLPDLPPELACLMMVMVKVSRELNAHKRDNLVDACGYVACVQRIEDRYTEGKYDES